MGFNRYYHIIFPPDLPVLFFLKFHQSIFKVLSVKFLMHTYSSHSFDFTIFSFPFYCPYLF